MPEPVLTVYTTPYCGDCHIVKRYLASRGIAYREVDLLDEPEARRFVRAVAGGHVSVPTVAFPDGRVLVEPGLGELADALGVRRLGR